LGAYGAVSGTSPRFMTKSRITGALTGNVALVDIDLANAFVNQHVALMRPKGAQVSPKYLAYCLYSRVGQAQFKTTEYGGTKQGLGLDEVKSVVVPVPPRAEQDVIVKALDRQLSALDIAIDRALREIALVREYRTRLIADVVTGKLDVREAVAKLPDDPEGSVALDNAAVLEGEEAEDEALEGVQVEAGA
jgi:type I restriction enzyme S subunit